MPIDLSQPSYPVRYVRNVMIPMPDGVLLSAELIMPDAPGRFPAILEFLPYRKDDMGAGYIGTHHYLAERGFVGVRLDVRGTGGSHGYVTDEYTPQEQDDACAAIDWLSRQPWCNGNVGMWGTSYGGFNSLQTAMHNPPALKAIVPHAATDDRYNDDVHYYGGCLMGYDQILYPAWMVPMNAFPPQAGRSGAGWARIWQEHLEGNTPWLLQWLHHQSEDDYWHQGSVKVDYGAIRCPVYHIGGWADGYTNATWHMLEQMPAPTKGLIGPWIHTRPNEPQPGPGFNYLHELARWWAHWLRDEDTGIMDEPKVAYYMQDGAPADPFLSHMPGEWRFSDCWPPEGVAERTLYLADGGALLTQPDRESHRDDHRYQATIGTAGGFWCPVGPPLGMARDQRMDEARSLLYTTPPLPEELALLGFPKATLFVSSSAEVAFFVVKISDVAPDGSSTLVSRGLLNATHRISHGQPVPLVPGEVYELEIPLKACSWTFQPGHRLRLAISSSDWPTIWPAPLPALNSVHYGGTRLSHIVLPVVEHVPATRNAPAFRPTTPLKNNVRGLSGTPPVWMISQDALSGAVTVRAGMSGKSSVEGESYVLERDTLAEITADDNDPGRASAKTLCSYTLIDQGQRTEVVGRTAIQSTDADLNVNIELRISVDGEPFFHRHWVDTVPRNLV